MHSLKKYVVIVAGGSGSRMGSEVPKQFIELCKLPVLMHTISVFRKAIQDIDIVLVLPEEQIKTWKSLCLKHNFITHVEICAGGETRFHSVKNGLSLLEGDGLVGIHDGVRPLVSEETIKRCYSEAAIYGNAIPVTEVVESVRYFEADKNRMIDRSKLRLVQTPQVFRLASVKEAFSQEYKESFTDDASVFESHGGIVHLTEGNRDNIKITHPIDLVIGEFLLNSRTSVSI
jgi:2-C-methyl-D-erythritol 4-phosphate cytidylyltransferase